MSRRVKDSPHPKSFSSGESEKLAAMRRCRLEALRTNEKGVGLALESVLRFDREIKRAGRTNLLEEAESSSSPLVAEEDTLRVKAHPFEVLTLRLEL